MQKGFVCVECHFLLLLSVWLARVIVVSGRNKAPNVKLMIHIGMMAAAAWGATTDHCVHRQRLIVGIPEQRQKKTRRCAKVGQIKKYVSRNARLLTLN
jgi:hypothetical protein